MAKAAVLVVLVAAVTGRDIKIVFIPGARTEANPTAVMIAFRMLECQQDLLRARVGVVGGDCRERELRNVGHSLLKSVSGRGIDGEVEVKLSISRVVRIERHAEKALLAATSKRRVRYRGKVDE